jgi:hypothetical protein
MRQQNDKKVIQTIPTNHANQYTQHNPIYKQTNLLNIMLFLIYMIKLQDSWNQQVF